VKEKTFENLFEGFRWICFGIYWTLSTMLIVYFGSEPGVFSKMIASFLNFVSFLLYFNFVEDTLNWVEDIIRIQLTERGYIK